MLHTLSFFIFKGGKAMQVINLLISAVIQFLLFSALPFLWWFVQKRKETPFFHWLGLKKPIIKNTKNYTTTVILIVLLFLSVSFIMPKIVDSSDTATSQFSGRGLTALLPAIIYSFLQTGLSEEIFFRGFLMRVLVDAFGFNVGNFVQALLFGILHGVFFFSVLGGIQSLLIILITGTTGLLMGWINERQSGGSIIPSWLLHGFANLLASLLAMFSFG